MSHRLNPVGRPRPAASALLVSGVELAVADVVGNRVVEQEVVLVDDADIRPQRGLGVFADVAAVDPDAPFLGS